MNQRGSSLIIVLVMLAGVSVSGYILFASGIRGISLQKQASTTQEVESISQVISTVVADKNICLFGFDNSGSEPGIEFRTGNSHVTRFNRSLASTESGQDLTLPSPFVVGSTRQRFENNFVVPGKSLQIRRLYAANAVQDPVDTDVYTVQVKADLQAIGDNSLPLRPRDVALLRLRLNAPGDVVDCEIQNSTASNRSLCISMGCEYTSNTDGGGGSCACPLRQMSCPTGQYISAISANGTPTCSPGPVKTCASQANSFISALDREGEPVCAQVTRCPAGTSTTGAGDPVPNGMCRCANLGEFWTGTNCGTPINGVCGPADGQVLAAAPSGAQLCTAGTAGPVAGTGPWSWVCNGSNSGASPACQATAGPPPPPVGTCTHIRPTSIGGGGCGGSGPYVPGSYHEIYVTGIQGSTLIDYMNNFCIGIHAGCCTFYETSGVRILGNDVSRYWTNKFDANKYFSGRLFGWRNRTDHRVNPAATTFNFNHNNRGWAVHVQCDY